MVKIKFGIGLLYMVGCFFFVVEGVIEELLLEYVCEYVEEEEGDEMMSLLNF